MKKTWLFALAALAFIGCSDDDSSPNDTTTCGNNRIDAGEQCDGTLFANGQKKCPEGTQIIDGKTINDIKCSDTCMIITADVCKPITPTTKECTTDDDCKEKGELTKCDTTNFVCVAPQPEPTKECNTDDDCKEKGELTKCDTANFVCVAPQPEPTKECTTDDDCKEKGELTKCDTANSVCVAPQPEPTKECNTDDDCATKNTCLTTYQCNSQNQCVEQTHIAPCTPDTCSGNAPVCDVTSKCCVGCSKDSDCGDAQVCNTATGACMPNDGECQNNEDCKDKSGKELCQNGICSTPECTDDTACTTESKPICQEYVCVSPNNIKCQKNTTCAKFAPATPVCNVTTGKCEKCTEDAQCGDKKYCAPDGQCLAGCTSNSDCTGTNDKCDTSSHQCVACLKDNDCKSGETCDETTHACVTGSCENPAGTGLYWCQMMPPVNVEFSPEKSSENMILAYHAGSDITTLEAELIYGSVEKPSNFTKDEISAWKSIKATQNASDNTFRATLKTTDLGTLKKAYYAFRIRTSPSAAWQYCIGNSADVTQRDCSLHPISEIKSINQHTAGVVSVTSTAIDDIIAEFNFDSLTLTNFSSKSDPIKADKGSAQLTTDSTINVCSNNKCFATGNPGNALNVKLSNKSLIITGLNLANEPHILTFNDYRTNVSTSPDTITIDYDNSGSGTFTNNFKTFSLTTKKATWESQTVTLPATVNGSNVSIKLTPSGGDNGNIRLDNIKITK